MKNILIVLQGDRFPESAFRFACQLNKLARVRLTGVVLPELPNIENWAAYSAASAGIESNTSASTNIQAFKKRCKEHDMQYTMHNGSTELILPQIVKETRFADLLVASDTCFFKESGQTPLEGLWQVMHRSECPVLVVPENALYPEQLIFAYDGSESSMFAIKQFSYLFPELRTLDTQLVYINKAGADVPCKNQLEEWLAGYFPKCTIITVNYDGAQYFSSEANPRPALVVTGSSGRTAISQLFHPSFAEDLISRHHLLIFTSHKR